MPKTKLQKQEAVSKYSDNLNRAKSVVLTDYRGLTMSQLGELRGKLAEQSAEFSITKNSLLERALDEAGYVLDQASLVGPVGTLFAYEDEVSPIKTLTKALKDFDKGQIKVGYLNKEMLSGEQVRKLAELPGKTELRGQVVGILVAPLLGVVNVLQGNVRNLVYVIDAIAKSKGGE